MGTPLPEISTDVLTNVKKWEDIKNEFSQKVEDSFPSVKINIVESTKNTKWKSLETLVNPKIIIPEKKIFKINNFEFNADKKLETYETETIKVENSKSGFFDWAHPSYWGF